MTKKAVWLSYDLGLDGDYEALYGWLDSQKARECGDSVAFFVKSSSSDVAKTIAKELKKVVKLRSRDRVYVISEGRGKFIFGKRKRAPWQGFGVGVPAEADEAR